MKKIVVLVICLGILVISGVIYCILVKPAFLYNFRYEVINMYYSVKIGNSKEYKDLKKTDNSIKYYKSEKNIHIPILLYHEISNEKSSIESYDMYTTVKQFEKQIKGLLDLGYTFISYEDLIAYNNNELALPEYVILLSFDDGYISNYINAFPIAKKYNIPFNFFVIDSCVGAENYFSWAQAKEMEESGLIHIYSHGKEHIYYGLENSDKVVEDVKFALNRIEQELGHEITKVFAYPFGSYSDESIEKLEKEGIVQNLLLEQYNESDNLELSRLTRIFVRQNYNVYRILKLIL